MVEQLAEQLVEVPTEPAFVEQTVDIPVLRGRRRRLQGFLPGKTSTASAVEQNVDMRRLKVFFSRCR